MADSRTLAAAPATPGIYVLYGSRGAKPYPAYVGIAGDLRDRLRQHFVLRDSSVTTAVGAAGLNPDYVSEIRWWVSDQFKERDALEAAELVAFDISEPTLSSRGHVKDSARMLRASPGFDAREDATRRSPDRNDQSPYAGRCPQAN